MFLQFLELPPDGASVAPVQVAPASDSGRLEEMYGPKPPSSSGKFNAYIQIFLVDIFNTIRMNVIVTLKVDTGTGGLLPLSSTT